MKTAMQEMIEFLNGILKIEDKLVLQYSKFPKAVGDIKTNWQQINTIKEIAIRLESKEKQQIIDAYNQDLYGGLDGHKKFDDGNDYYNQTFKP